MATSANDLRELLKRFLSGAASPQELQLELASLLRVNLANDLELESLVHRIQSALASTAAGDMTSEELRKLLSTMAEPVKLDAGAVRFKWQSYATTAAEKDHSPVSFFYFVAEQPVCHVKDPSLLNMNVAPASGSFFVPNGEPVIAA